MNIKKTISAILAAFMMISSISINSIGAETISAEEQLAMDKSIAADIMTGTNIGFEPEKNITRGEAAAIMTRLKGITISEIKAASEETPFLDVAPAHWASRYINVLVKKDLLKEQERTTSLQILL